MRQYCFITASLTFSEHLEWVIQDGSPFNPSIYIIERQVLYLYPLSVVGFMHPKCQVNAARSVCTGNGGTVECHLCSDTGKQRITKCRRVIQASKHLEEMQDLVMLTICPREISKFIKNVEVLNSSANGEHSKQRKDLQGTGHND